MGNHIGHQGILLTHASARRGGSSPGSARIPIWPKGKHGRHFRTTAAMHHYPAMPASAKLVLMSNPPVQEVVGDAPPLRIGLWGPHTLSSGGGPGERLSNDSDARLLGKREAPWSRVIGKPGSYLRLDVVHAHDA